ncbi:MAG: tetratricopeptide repeat protein [Rhizomicrobium sp.]
MAKVFLHDKKYDLAALHLKPLADTSPEAARLYGDLLVNGPHCVTADAKKGEAYLRKAADAGDTTAKLLLAGYYFNGTRLAQNDEQAFHLYSQTAETGDAVAAVNLAIMYLNGRGTSRDFHLYLKWAVRGAEAGRPAALGMIASSYMYGNVLPKDPKEAYFWICTAVDRLSVAPSDVRENIWKKRNTIAAQLSVDDAQAIARAAKAWSPGARSLDKVLKAERSVPAGDPLPAGDPSDN